MAPVTREGATHWTVYLPAGAWHDFWTHEQYHGPGGVTVPAPLDRLPLFVRAGALVPFGPVMQYDGECASDALTLLIYPRGRSSFTLYDDDGISNAYLAGGYAETEFVADSNAAGCICSVEAPTGDAGVIPAGRGYTFCIHALKRPANVGIDGIGRLAEGEAGVGPAWWHDGSFVHIRLARHPSTARVTW